MPVLTKIDSELKWFGPTGSARKAYAGSKLDDINKFATVINTAEFSVGFTNDKHPDSDLTYSQLAKILEFGSPSRNIPARPYLEKSSKIVISNIKTHLTTAMIQLANSKVKLTKAQISDRLSVVADKAAERTKSVIRNRSVGVADNEPTYRQRKLAAGHSGRPWIRTGDLVSNIQGFVRLV